MPSCVFEIGVLVQPLYVVDALESGHLQVRGRASGILLASTVLAWCGGERWCRHGDRRLHHERATFATWTSTLSRSFARLLPLPKTLQKCFQKHCTARQAETVGKGSSLPEYREARRVVCLPENKATGWARLNWPDAIESAARIRAAHMCCPSRCTCMLTCGVFEHRFGRSLPCIAVADIAAPQCVM